MITVSIAWLAFCLLFTVLCAYAAGYATGKSAGKHSQRLQDIQKRSKTMLSVLVGLAVVLTTSEVQAHSRGTVGRSFRFNVPVRGFSGYVGHGSGYGYGATYYPSNLGYGASYGIPYQAPACPAPTIAETYLPPAVTYIPVPVPVPTLAPTTAYQQQAPLQYQQPLQAPVAPCPAQLNANLGYAPAAGIQGYASTGYGVGYASGLGYSGGLAYGTGFVRGFNGTGYNRGFFPTRGSTPQHIPFRGVAPLRSPVLPAQTITRRTVTRSRTTAR